MAAEGAVCALIPAAGRGVRFGATDNKVFAPLRGRPLLGWTLEAFARCDAVENVILIGGEDDLPRLREIAATYGGGKVKNVVSGGIDRQESVRNGLAACPRAEYVVIHDGARPCVTSHLISQTIQAARLHGGAATAAIPVADTLVRGKSDLLEGPDVPRDGLYQIQTPQAFRRAVLWDAHEAALREGYKGTDDAGLVRRMTGATHHCKGAAENIKVTFAEDLALAETILMQRQAFTPSLIRIGHGYDVHQFAEGRRLFLGGVEFPDAPRGLLGHSDADVVLHAVCDALLGASGMGDIGVLFPPSDIAHKDRSSREFLAEVKVRLDAAGWRVGNVDVTVLAETPKIGPRAQEMRAIIAQTLGVSSDDVGIKATTNETMGFVGRGEGIAAHAVALLVKG